MVEEERVIPKGEGEDGGVAGGGERWGAARGRKGWGRGRYPFAPSFQKMEKFKYKKAFVKKYANVSYC